MPSPGQISGACKSDLATQMAFPSLASKFPSFALNRPLTLLPLRMSTAFLQHENYSQNSLHTALTRLLPEPCSRIPLPIPSTAFVGSSIAVPLLELATLGTLTYLLLYTLPHASQAQPVSLRYSAQLLTTVRHQSSYTQQLPFHRLKRCTIIDAVTCDLDTLSRVL